MDIEEYRKSYLDELRFSAEYEGTETEYQFINKMLADWRKSASLMTLHHSQLRLRVDEGE